MINLSTSQKRRGNFSPVDLAEDNWVPLSVAFCGERREAVRISFFTKQFDPILRFAKDCERRFDYLKYRLRGNAYKAWTCTFPLGGHQDVVESFLKGASHFPEVEVLLNPSPSEARSSVAYVQHSWRILRDVIEMKRAGLVEKLVAGPMICYQSPFEFDGIVTDDAIDCYLLASDWVREDYLTECRKMGRTMKNIQIWPAGVDENEWFPTEMKETNPARRAMLYLKHDTTKLDDVRALLSERGIECRTLAYGKYVPDDYKRMLEWCDFVVIFGESETQGMTLFQAWSMNRPTLVYESRSVIAHKRDAAPYLTPQTGSKWHDTDELRALLGSLPACTPRQWVLENGTNKVSFRRFLDIVESLED